MRTLFLLLCVSAGGWAATCTVASSATFAAVCTDGDSVVINNGVTLTIPANTTAIVGASPSDDTGTPAIKCATDSGTGVLDVYGKLIYRGPVRQCAGWTIRGGGTVQYDASYSSAPTTAQYTWSTTSTSAVLTTTGTAPNGTSATSLTLGTGAISLTTQASLGYTAGQRIRITSIDDRRWYMTCPVTSYSGTTLTCTVDYAVGPAWTLANWSIGISVSWDGAGNGAGNGACNSYACRAGLVGAILAYRGDDAGIAQMAYTDFAHMGNATAGFGVAAYYLSIGAANVSCQHVTWDDSAAVIIREIASGTGTFLMDGISITNTRALDQSYGVMQFSFATPAGSPPSRVVKNSYFAGKVNDLGTGTGHTAFQFQSIVFDAAAADNIFGGFGSFSTANTTDQVLVMNQTTGASDGGFEFPGATNTRWYSYDYHDGTGDYLHPAGMHYYVASVIDGAVFETSRTAGHMLMPFDTVAYSGAATVEVKNSIYHCGEYGGSGGSWLNWDNGVFGARGIAIHNNTYCVTGSQAWDSAVVAFGVGWEANPAVTGAFARIDSNLAYQMTAGHTLVGIAAPATKNAGTIGILGYNAVYNNSDYTGAAASNYGINFTSSGQVTTGPSNDQNFSRAPVFADTNITNGSRRLISFDTGYLGKPTSGTVWTAGLSYAAGTIVSDSQVTVFHGASFNWISLSNSGGCATAATGNRPITGTTSWVNCWRPAAWQYIVTSVLNDETVTDASIGATGVSLIGALNLWSRAGYKPSGADGTALRSSGYGGTYIGAVAPDRAPGLFPLPNSLVR